MECFSGKKILITGASSGIGRATAIKISENGGDLVLVGTRIDALKKTLSLLGEGKHSLIVIDFLSGTLESDLKMLFKQTGKVDGFLHCAGIHSSAPLKVQDYSKTETLYKINVFSALSIIKELRKKNNHSPGCSAVLMSSVSALLGESAISAYASSKSALIGLTKSLSAELVKDNIRINCISAGIVKTEMTESFFEKLDDNYVRDIESKHALGFGMPNDVANAVMFLLSESASWITGSNLVVDGGYSAIK